MRVTVWMTGCMGYGVYMNDNVSRELPRHFRSVVRIDKVRVVFVHDASPLVHSV